METRRGGEQSRPDSSQQRPPTQSHGRHRRRTTINSIESKKNAKNQQQEHLTPSDKNSQSLSNDSLELGSLDRQVGGEVGGEVGREVISQAMATAHSVTPSRLSPGAPSTPNRTEDGDVDSHADGDDYFDAVSGLSSPDPHHVKPQVTIHVEKDTEDSKVCILDLSCILTLYLQPSSDIQSQAEHLKDTASRTSSPKAMQQQSKHSSNGTAVADKKVSH